MKITHFPQVYEILAKKFLNDKDFPCDKVSIFAYQTYCSIILYYKGKRVDIITSNRKELLSKMTTFYKVKIDTNDQLHYFINGAEIIDEAVLKEKLEFLRSLFFQKTIIHHFDDSLEEQDFNHIIVTPQLREFVNTYLDAVINSLEG